MPDDEEYHGDGLPPNHIPTEQALLGALMLDPTLVKKAVGTLSVSDFYREGHQEIFRTILSLHNEGKPVETIPIIEDMQRRGVMQTTGSGFGYFMALVDSAVDVSAVDYYIETVQMYADRRRLMEFARKLHHDAQSSMSILDCGFMILNARNDLEDLSKAHIINDAFKLGDCAADDIHEIEMRHKNPHMYPSRLTGIDRLDQKNGHIDDGTTTVIAALPGFGKSSFAHQIAAKWALDYKVPVGIWSGEMSKKEIARRRVSAHTGIDSLRIKSWYTLSDSEKAACRSSVKYLDALPFYIIPPGDPSIIKCASNIRAYTDKYGIGLWVIDHMGHLQSDRYKNSKVNEVGHVSDVLKDLALSLNVPFLVLSQLNRGLFKRDDKRPNRGDIRDSATIEANAGNIWFIHQPRAFTKDKEPVPAGQCEEVEIIIDKSRNGNPGIVKCGWVASTTEFVNLASKKIEPDFVPFLKPMQYEPDTDFAGEEEE